MIRIACIGECMIELSRIELTSGKAHLGFAGDTFNTAVYLSRLLSDKARVSYVTTLGMDGFSTRILDILAQEGLDTALIGRHPTRLPGLYSIETDPAGERSFHYWRDASAARTLFSGPGATLEDLAAFEAIYLSGITLAILPAEVREALITRLGHLRAAGCRIVFDTNFRPRLWPDTDAARRGFAAMWRATSLGLPSHEDERLLHPGETAEATLARIAAQGVSETVLKMGPAGVLIGEAGHTLRPDLAPRAQVIDTTGAGDSFNAGYLAARLSGRGAAEAAQAGHRLAGAVIGHHGAILPRGMMPA